MSKALDFANSNLGDGEFTGFRLPSGTTGQRPATGNSGDLRFNTTTGSMEYWSSGDFNPQWRDIDEAAQPDPVIDYLVVAGGGGGGAGYRAGGGGAGGYRTSVGTSGGNSSAENGIVAVLGTAYSLVVGAGGTRGTGVNHGNSDVNRGQNGGDSTFATVTSTGGGGGGTYFTAPRYEGRDGGSGGGAGGGHSTALAAGDGTTNQGFKGGESPSNSIDAGGGGGGAGGAGADSGTSEGASNGGVGLATTLITTSMASTYSVGEVSSGSVYFAGGGAGGTYNVASAGTVNQGGLGGGGDTTHATSAQTALGAAATGGTNTGGGGAGNPSNQEGANGGSGVIILRTPTNLNATFTSGVTANGATGSSISPDTSISGYRTYVITAAASGQTVTFST